MVSFKAFYTERTTLGIIEDIDIDGIGIVKAKVDSGNQGYNVLHASEITPHDDSVTFNTVNGKSFKKKVIEKVKIHIGSGHKEDRFVVTFNVKVGSQFFSDIPFSLGDRVDNEEPVLLGEPFIRQLDALIDVNKSRVIENADIKKIAQLKDDIKKLWIEFEDLDNKSVTTYYVKREIDLKEAEIKKLESKLPKHLKPPKPPKPHNPFTKEFKAAYDAVDRAG